MTKKLTSLMLALVMCLSLCVPAFAEDARVDKTISATMPANTIVTYNDDLEAVVTHDGNLKRSAVAASNEEVASFEALQSEEEAVARIEEEAKDLPVYNEEYVLPTPVAGMTVTYGSDGEISHIYYPTGIQASNTARANPGVGHTAAAGTYTFGQNNSQTIKITSTGVTGEGTFTVFRSGVGGSGSVGSSGKTLGTGDVATNMTYDNAAHNTAMDARALDTDILKTVYKNDIGGLPNAVLDVYFWGWDLKYFGYMYSDTLSFPGRYHYNF